MFDFSLTELIAGLPGLILALVFHEYAHARAAVAFGDLTPKIMGRLTLNPVAHIDPIGLIMLLLVRFGWAKPVVINPNNFRNPRRDDLLVSLAGPMANFALAFLAMLIWAILIKMQIGLTTGTLLVLQLIVLYNINFGLFNLIPLPPLDGSHVLSYFLPYSLAQKFWSLERYSFLILIVLIMTPVLTMILIPLQKLILFSFNGILQLLFF